MSAARVHRFALGSNSSHLARATPSTWVPPAINTRPSFRRVAVCATCASSRFGAGAHVPESVALASAGIGPLADSPIRIPATRTRRSAAFTALTYRKLPAMVPIRWLAVRPLPSGQEQAFRRSERGKGEVAERGKPDRAD